MSMTRSNINDQNFANKPTSILKKGIPLNNELIKKLEQLKAYKNYTFDDKGFSTLFSEIYKDSFKYNVTAKEWYHYNGKVWVEDTGSMLISQSAKEFADNILIYCTTIPDEARRNNFQKYATRLGQYKYREIMVKDSRDEHFIQHTDLNINRELFNCQNGTLNLKTFDFHTHCSSDLLSKISNVIYNQKSKTTVFEKFINEIFENDINKIKYIQKILGYALTTDTSLETCFIFYGKSTRNGKSTLIETISYVLGNTEGYAMTATPETFTMKFNRDSRSPSGDIARLNECRFLSASEPPKRMIIDNALLKTLLGRDRITARHIQHRESEFYPKFKLFINCNHLPLIHDDTLFNSSRINVIPFNRHFEDHEQDKNLKEKLKQQEEISGIFNLLLDGLKLFYKEGVIPPEAIKEATQDYRDSSDKIGQFIKECLKQTGKNSKISDVYKIYKLWCDDNGYNYESKSNFIDEIKHKNLFLKSGTVNNNSYKNVVKDYQLI